MVIFDRHSTARLPQGNYFFFGAVPLLSGIAAGEVISDQVIFNWDDTHPILRHVAIESLQVYEWLTLKLPTSAVSIIEGETSPVLSYLTRDASQFLISAFSLITEDDAGNSLMNTYWVTSVDFVVFMQNAVYYLAASVATAGEKSIRPGDPVTLPLPAEVADVLIHRPDGAVDKLKYTAEILAEQFGFESYAAVEAESLRDLALARAGRGCAGLEQLANGLLRLAALRNA